MSAMLSRFVLGASVGLASITAAAAQTVEQFYKSNPINIVVGTGTGGSFDLQARIVARHLGRFIPGSPAIVVQNMPGAGGIVAANKIYNTAPKDGTVIGLINGTAMLEPLFGGSSIQFDPRKFIWIGGGSVKLPGSCFVWHTSAIRNAQDLFEKDVIIGATTGNTNLVFPVALKEVLGVRMKIVRGYNSTNEVLLAMERGEVEGTCGLAWAGISVSRAHWIADKLVRMVLMIYVTPDPSWPKDVPNALEFAKSNRYPAPIHGAAGNSTGSGGSFAQGLPRPDERRGLQ
jgi:tripartite-type tricarboxylate transporter receptor subunit TctC